MKRFNKQNCTSSVRAQITDKWGRTITLMGTHAFDWTIYVEEALIRQPGVYKIITDETGRNFCYMQESD
jgi:hypothetical protein